MENEEAIKLLIQLRCFIIDDIHYHYDYAEAIKSGIEVLEKQMPKRLKRNTLGEWFECPNCENVYNYDVDEYDCIYCPDCGQLLDLSVQEETE